MKFVSWNVNGLRACVEKGFREIFDNFDVTSSACRRPNSSRGRSILRQRAIMPIGITPKRRAIPARRCLPGRNRFPCSMA